MNFRFTEIREFDGSRNTGFEELICQIARRSPPQDAQEFRRIEGAGGDGGVEAYWIVHEGKKVGYQAKYFLATKDINWSQIDKSVATALDKHPELREYVVAIACDLTDRAGKKGRGLRGWEHWDNHKAKWEDWASEKSINISFVAWTKSYIVDCLISSESAGLATYWFDTPRLDSSWFFHRFEEAKADLDERYHPEDHVEVSISRLFQGMGRTDDFQNRLKRAFDRIPRLSKVQQHILSLKKQPDDDLIAKADFAIAAVQKVGSAIPIEPYTPLLIADWNGLVRTALELISDIDDWLWSGDREKENSGRHGQSNYDLDRARARLSQASDALRALATSLEDIDVQGALKRAALVIGNAGTGKSHLFADTVDKALVAEKPAVLLLGQYFSSADPWKTILSKLDLSNYSTDQFLGALDAAAEAARNRCLILIDALNEANDLKVWRDHIAGVVQKVLRYENLALTLSCRPEYEDVLIPMNCKDDFVQVKCYGFTTPEEQENAARQYLEKRGLVRPAMPWLAPEFVNPLFLRTCCDALKAGGKSEFPRGLRGTKEVFRFYLENLQDRLHRRFPAISLPRDCVTEGLLSIAAQMARDQRDNVTRANGEEIFAKVFRSAGPISGGSWLDVLIQEGALRRDHQIEGNDDDPLAISREVFRFAYQRFSDHLIVAALLQSADDPTTLFREDGPVSFIFDDEGINWDWYSLVPALAIQVPEKFKGAEFVDLLPGAFQKWWRYHTVREAFAESILWRDKDAFGKRTRELFNMLSDEYFDPRLNILIQLSIIRDHPWNADFLDRYLWSKRMPERDAIWSVELADATDDEEHPLHGPLYSLIKWGLRADKARAEDETLRLTAIILVWCFTTSSRPIRDQATKALIAVLIERPHLFPLLLTQYSGIDDLYVLERLCAAGFGAACYGIPDEKLEAMADAIFNEIFKDGSPPVHLLMRDYALGIVELAEYKGCCPNAVDRELCRPPYESDWPLEQITEGEIDKARQVAGDDAIYHSAFSWGDFERYEIEPHLRDFTSVPLAAPAPLNDEQKLEHFLRDLPGWGKEKKAAFFKLQQAVEHANSTRMINHDREKTFTITFTVDENALKQVERAEKQLLALLSEEQSATYNRLAVSKLFPDRVPHDQRGIPDFDTNLAKRWVTKRAYDYGWTKSLFAKEPGEGLDRKRPIVERIGKKYQWLALSELMARLSDNVWMKHSWPDSALRYEHACQTGFVRDIEPTIFPRLEGEEIEMSTASQWWLPRMITYKPEPDSAVAKWPFEDRDLYNSPEQIEVTDHDGRKWLVLKSFFHADEKFEDDRLLLSFRRMAFVRVSSIIVSKRDAPGIEKALKGKTLTDPTNWEHVDVTDGPYLLEYPWRRTWQGIFDEWIDDSIGILEGHKFVRPVIEHTWESHLDTTLPKGSRISMPSPWLAKQLKLSPHPFEGGNFVDDDGRLLFTDPTVGSKVSNAGLIDRGIFFEFLDANELECFWVIAGEKMCSPTGQHEHCGWRYHNAVYRWTGSKWRGKPWSKDGRRGLSVFDSSLTDLPFVTRSPNEAP